MDLPTARRVLTVEEYGAELSTLVAPDRRAEDLALEEAGERVLAADVISAVTIPAFDNSAMDGYAVRSADLDSVPVRLQVVGEVPAGSAADPFVQEGTCVRIMTGAALPTGADAVVPVEDTDGGVDVVEVLVAPRPAAHVRRAGEDVGVGAVLAHAGDVLTPGRIGALAAAGVVQVAVRPRPVVAVAATGDELVTDGSPLSRGQIHESNSRALAASLGRDGARVVRSRPLPDQAEALVAWLDEQAPGADLLVLTGGASVGAFDVVRDVLAGAGGSFVHVRMQPGKPQGWAVWKGTPVIALPGNPVSAVLSYEVFVRPLLDRVLGRSSPGWTPAVAGAGWRSPAGRRQLVPVVTTVDPSGRVVVHPSHQRGSASHLVSALGEATGIAEVAEDMTQVNPGDLVHHRGIG